MPKDEWRTVLASATIYAQHAGPADRDWASVVQPPDLSDLSNLKSQVGQGSDIEYPYSVEPTNRCARTGVGVPDGVDEALNFYRTS